MEIGGLARRLRAPLGISLGDVILRYCRSIWPNCLFRDAEEETDRPLSDPWVWNFGTRSHEFFVTRDAEASQSWDHDGPTASNVNTMLHFMLTRPVPNATETFVTVIFDAQSSEIETLLGDLSKAFFFEFARPRQDAA